MAYTISLILSVVQVLSLRVVGQIFVSTVCYFALVRQKTPPIKWRGFAGWFEADLLCRLISGRSWQFRSITWMGKAHQLKGKQRNHCCILVTWHNIYYMFFMDLQDTAVFPWGRIIMEQLCLVLFLKADPACGHHEILTWTMSRTVYQGLLSPCLLRINLQTVLMVCGNSLLIICRNPRILNSRLVQRKKYLTRRCKTTNLISHKGVLFFTYFKSSTAAAQTEFWHSWRTSPEAEQASVIRCLASKQLSAGL